MRTSLKRTPAAVLRTILGIKDTEMADLVGCKPVTIHSLECGRLRMSEDMAMRIYDQTEISPQWLLAGDAKAPPEAADSSPYTKAIFERVQARKAGRNRPPRAWVLLEWVFFCAQLLPILSSARKQSKYYMARYKAQKAIEALKEDFGQDPTVLDLKSILSELTKDPRKLAETLDGSEFERLGGLFEGEGLTVVKIVAMLESLRETRSEAIAQLASPPRKRSRKRKRN